MPEFKLLTYRDNGRARAGVLCADRVYPATSLLRDRADLDASTILGLLASWDTALPAVRTALERPDVDAKPLADVTLLAPILYPGAIFCSRGNYFDHLQEMAKIAGRPAPQKKRETAEPYYVLKTSAHSVIGTGEPIHLPAFA